LNNFLWFNLDPVEQTPINSLIPSLPLPLSRTHTHTHTHTHTFIPLAVGDFWYLHSYWIWCRAFERL